MRNYDLEAYLNGRDPKEALDFDYVVVKMTSGETVFTAVSELDADNYCAMLPLKLASIAQGGTYVSAMVEYMVGSDDVFMVLPKSSCILVSFMSDKTLDEYKRAMKKVLDAIDPEMSDEVMDEFDDDEDLADNVFTFKAPTTKQ